MATLVKKIDIHVHSTPKKYIDRITGGDLTTPEELRKMYDHYGIEFGVQLPTIHPESIAYQVTNEMSYDMVQAHPETYVWFCNLDPRMMLNSEKLDFGYFIEHYKAMGAKGIGEMCCNMDMDDPLVENLFRHAEKHNMPVTIHIGDYRNDYGLIDSLGLPKLERALQKFPNLKILGHSQKFWAEISGDCNEERRAGYPTGKVTPGGRVPELLRKYPNLLGDLSAGSGENAIMRDPEFGYAFLEEFQDKLFFGTDTCDPRNVWSLPFFLDDAVQNGKISQDCYNKVCRENALKLLGMK